jgi:hypothetical protein
LFYSIEIGHMAHIRNPNFNFTSFENLCKKIKFNNQIELLNELEKINQDKKNTFKSSKLNTRKRIKCEIYDFFIFT